MEQINIFEYCPELLPPEPKVQITALQLEKVYNGLFSIKWMRKKIECGDVESTIKRMENFTTGGCLGMGIGWSEQNPTTFWLDKRGIEFDNDGVYHSFKDVAALLIHKYTKKSQEGNRV